MRARVLALLLLAGHVSSSEASGIASGPAGSCVSISATGNNTTQIVNGCRVTVQVGYCSTDKPISGKRCGDRPNVNNPFYTHLTSISPGATSVIGQPERSLKLAPCQGSMDNFRAAMDGTFSCDGKNFEPLAWTYAVRRTQTEACEAARATVAPHELIKVPCECKPLASGNRFYCRQATSLSIEQVKGWDNFIQDIQYWLRRELNAPCEGDSCRGGTGIGVRG